MPDEQTSERLERTDPYLRPNQASELLEERNGLESMLNAPSHISGQIQDKASMMRHMRHIETTLHKDLPKPYVETEKDNAATRERELRESMLLGIPTHAEMRKNPPGATDKHRSWESRNKVDLQEWKNIRLRMHATGMLNAPDDASDVANFEQFRPHGGAQELNFDNAQIPGQQYSFPSGQISIQNVASPEERDRFLAERDRMSAEMNERGDNESPQETGGVVIPKLE